MGPRGITVNAAPGFIITEMTVLVPEKVLKMMNDKTPLGRAGLPRDVANANESALGFYKRFGFTIRRTVLGQLPD